MTFYAELFMKVSKFVEWRKWMKWYPVWLQKTGIRENGG
jgi:hypothetical protein